MLTPTFRKAWLFWHWEWDSDADISKEEPSGITLEEPPRGKYRMTQEIVWAVVEGPQE